MSGYEDMRAKILDAAILHLEHEGESSIRLRTIAVDVGLALPTLDHYFQNRASLVTAAHATRFTRHLSRTLDPFLEAVERCTSRDDLVAAFIDFYAHSHTPARRTLRALRAEITGIAAHNDLLRRDIVAALHEALTPAVDAMAMAKSRGWLPSHVDPQAFAWWNLSNLSGAVFPELTADEDLIDEWNRIALDAVIAIVSNDTPVTIRP